MVGILAAALSAGSAFEPDLLLLDQAPAPVRRIVDMPAPVSPATAEVMGRFKFTYYWVAEQGEAEGNVPIHDRKCKVLARVPRSVRDAMRLEGSGRLADGRVLNYWGKCRCSSSPCFFEVAPTRPWGLGVGGHHLSPFRSVAVDPRRIPIGTPLYVAELDGLRMPGRLPFGGFVHDGCVVAADRGGNIRGRQLDFFVAARRNFLSLRKLVGQRVSVYRDVERCRDRRPAWTPRDLEVVDAGLDRVREAWDGLRAATRDRAVATAEPRG